MSRVETIGAATLYLGDCREILPTLGNVDAVVTDPPYGIGFKYESHVDERETYREFIWPIIEKAESLVVQGGPIFVWQAQEWMAHFSELFPRPWRIMISAKNFVQMNRHEMVHAYEPVVVWWRPGDRYVAPVGEGIGTPRDWHVADSAGGLLRNKQSGASEHPCPRQLDAMEFPIGNWVRPNAIVLDPFMGSGTTGVACIKLGRRFIGIEIEPRYFDIACRRIEEATRQGDMFVEQPRAWEQAALALPE